MTQKPENPERDIAMSLGTPLRIVMDCTEQPIFPEGSADNPCALRRRPAGGSRGMPDGTTGGRAAVMLAIDVDGQKVIAQTTLRLLTQAVRALNGRYGD